MPDTKKFSQNIYYSRHNIDKYELAPTSCIRKTAQTNVQAKFEGSACMTNKSKIVIACTHAQTALGNPIFKKVS